MSHGGKRPGAGRPKGSGKFGEPTKAVRLPVSKIELVMQFIEQKCAERPSDEDHVTENNVRPEKPGVKSSATRPRPRRKGGRT